MNIITSTGYGGTGSSVVIDIFYGHPDVHNLGDHELWFLQEFWGVTDLEYFVTKCAHRSKVSHAIYQYEKNVVKNANLYNKLFNDTYVRLSNDFIRNITTSTFVKARPAYEVDSFITKIINYELPLKITKLRNRILGVENKEVNIRHPTRTHKYSTLNEIEFKKEVRKYVASLFDSIFVSTGKSNVVCDQLVPAMGYTKYLPYIDNLKVIIVDRDPRDIYLNNKYIWKGAPYICDTTDVDQFIDWYKSIRYHSDENNCSVLRINFEDFIYKTKDAISSIMKFAELDERKFDIAKSTFVRENSAINVGLWKKYKDCEIEYIQLKLKDYCHME